MSLIVARQGFGKNPPIVDRQRLGRNVAAVTNTHKTIEELSDASFSMWPVSYQGKYAISSSQNFLFQNKESRLNKKPKTKCQRMQAYLYVRDKYGVQGITH
jgi:hypothetical protein